MLNQRYLAASFLVVLAVAAKASAQVGALPEVGKAVLRLEGGGPTSEVAALAFSPDGKTLYAAGWDKVVRIWKLNNAGQFVPQDTAFRVPIGPGLYGAINALALSPDGAWLAVGGAGAFRGQSDFRDPGLMVSTADLTDEMKQDVGRVFVFPTTGAGKVRELRGHQGFVFALAFVHPRGKAQEPYLVSVAQEVNGKKKSGEVRLWDVFKQKCLAQQSALPDPQLGSSVGLAAWRTGPNPHQVQAALAFDHADKDSEGTLRLWDASSEQLHATKDGAFDNTAVFLPGTGKLLTGSFLPTTYPGELGFPGQGRLQLWTPGPDQPPVPHGHPVVFPFKPGAVRFPRAVALLSSQADGQLDSAAVVLRAVPEEDFLLKIVPLPGSDVTGMKEHVRLWKVGRVPLLAAAPKGRHLAVSGGPGQAIRIYGIQDLLQGKTKPYKLLQSIGARIGYAAFLRQGEGNQAALGLLLAEKRKAEPGDPPRPPQDGDMTFDFAARRLSSQIEGWELDTPDPGGWSHTYKKPARTENGKVLPPTLLLHPPNGKPVPIALPEGTHVADLALLPKSFLKVPLVAVALQKGYEPTLNLYNARSGQQYCEFQGHTGPIYSVAFSADGRFLVSAAADQTVCLWSLNKLDQVIGKQGQLHGVRIKEVKADKRTKLVVTRVAAAGPDRGLQVGDEITGLVDGKAFTPFDSFAHYYHTLRTRPPGKATLRTNRGDVEVTLGQAVTGRTPLLCLFLTQKDQAEQREWLAWNPVGPYDSSSPRAARAFGWHTNTGNGDQPTNFTAADLKLPKERRKDLLKYLIQHASLGPALEDWERHQKLPRPKINLDVRERDGTLVRQLKSTLLLHVDDFRFDQIADVSWQLDKGPLQKLTLRGAELRSADYEQAVQLPKRGDFKVRAILTTREDNPQKFEETIVVRFRPAALQIKPLLKTAEAIEYLKKNHAPLRWAEKQFRLKADFEGGLPNEAVNALLYVNQEKPRPLADIGPTADLPIKLTPGTNNLKLVAWPAGALPGEEDLETGQILVVVDYVPDKPPPVTPPPVVTMQSVVPLLGGTEESEPLLIGKNKTVIVSVPRVRLQGIVTAAEKLTRVQMTDENGKPRALKGDLGRVFAVNELVVLSEAGKDYTVRIAAEAVGGKDPGSDTVTLKYQPGVPHLAPLAHNRAKAEFFEKGKGAPVVRISGPLSYRDPPPPGVKVSVTVLQQNRDKVESIEAENDANQKSWSAQVKLKPGENHFQAQATNEWHTGPAEGTLRLSYWRTPFNLGADFQGKTNKADLVFAASADSLLPLDKTSAKATVNGRPVAVEDVSPPAPGSQTYKLRLRAPLQEGENRVVLWVRNAEGEVFKDDFPPVVYTPDVPPPAVAFFVFPPGSSADEEKAIIVTKPQIKVRVVIKSRGPLKQVSLALKKDGGQVEYRPFALDKVQKTEARFELATETEVALAPGLTRLRVEASNATDRATAPGSGWQLIRYEPPPPKVVLEVIEPKNQADASMPIGPGPSGLLSAGKSPKARVFLRGRVIWAPGDSGYKQDPVIAAVYVNGSQQWRKQLGKATEQKGAVERAFRAELLLDRAKGNQIEVDLPDLLRLDKNPAQRRFVVDCGEPLPQRWLHVQIVSPGEKKPNDLIDQVLKTLDADNREKVAAPRIRWKFSRAGFDQALLYNPMIDADPYTLNPRLHVIREQIRLRAEDGWPNDVVLIYYVGDGQIEKGRVATLTYGSPPRELITRAKLEQFFAGMLGVKVVLLDLTGKGAASPKIQQEISQFLDGQDRNGWLGAAWLNPARKAPPNASLLAVLGAALRQSASLQQAGTLAFQTFQELRRVHPLDPFVYLPPDLDLPLRKKR
jgi:WD40 repeat protein